MSATRVKSVSGITLNQINDQLIFADDVEVRRSSHFRNGFALNEVNISSL